MRDSASSETLSSWVDACVLLNTLAHMIVVVRAGVGVFVFHRELSTSSSRFCWQRALCQGRESHSRIKEVKEQEGRTRKNPRKNTEVRKKGKRRREKRKARRAGPPLTHPKSRSPAPGGCILIASIPDTSN